MMILNKKVQFNYNIEYSIEAGISLLGNEVKSIRKGTVSIQDAFVVIENNEAFVVNLNISQYSFAIMNINYNPKRKRKLLLNRNEINKINGFLSKGGYTVVISKCYTNKKNFIKLEISIVSGKNNFDKRNYIREKDERRASTMKFSD